MSVHPLSLVASNVLFCCLMERGDKQAAHALLQELGKQTGTPIEDLQTAYDPLRLNVCLFTQEEANSIPMELLSLVDSIPEVRSSLTTFLVVVQRFLPGERRHALRGSACLRFPSITSVSFTMTMRHAFYYFSHTCLFVVHGIAGSL